MSLCILWMQNLNTVLFVCDHMFGLFLVSCNIFYVHVYLRTMVDVCCLISLPLNIPVNELVAYCVLCSNSYLTQVQCSAT